VKKTYKEKQLYISLQQLEMFPDKKMIEYKAQENFLPFNYTITKNLGTKSPNVWISQLKI
jgi:hypothetical protein